MYAQKTKSDFTASVARNEIDDNKSIAINNEVSGAGIKRMSSGPVINKMSDHSYRNVTIPAHETPGVEYDYVKDPNSNMWHIKVTKLIINGEMEIYPWPIVAPTTTLDLNLKRME